MFCRNCGTQMADTASFCIGCGQQLSPPNVPMVPMPMMRQPTPMQGQPIPMQGQIPMGNPYAQPRVIPQCTCCGYIGDFKAGPLLKGSDWVIFLALLFLFGSGFIYLIITIVSRSNPANREKICPNCRSQNMFTYVY